MKKILAIVGSRPPKERKARDAWLERVKPLLYTYIDQLDPAEWYIISGGAQGIDQMAAGYARRKGFEVFDIGANWSFLGEQDRAAGMKRNTFVVQITDLVTAFWDGESRGTRDTITKARNAGKLRDIVEIG